MASVARRCAPCLLGRLVLGPVLTAHGLNVGGYASRMSNKRSEDLHEPNGRHPCQKQLRTRTKKDPGELHGLQHVVFFLRGLQCLVVWSDRGSLSSAHVAQDHECPRHVVARDADMKTVTLTQLSEAKIGWHARERDD